MRAFLRIILVNVAVQVEGVGVGRRVVQVGMTPRVAAVTKISTSPRAAATPGIGTKGSEKFTLITRITQVFTHV